MAYHLMHDGKGRTALVHCSDSIMGALSRKPSKFDETHDKTKDEYVYTVQKVEKCDCRSKGEAR